MKVLYNYVLVIPDMAETVGGIILSSAPTGTGKVAFAGEGTWEHGKWIHNEIEVGDTIQYYPEYASNITIKGTEYMLLRASDVICILNKE